MYPKVLASLLGIFWIAATISTTDVGSIRSVPAIEKN
jgi:hypothetical protein